MKISLTTEFKKKANEFTWYKQSVKKVMVWRMLGERSKLWPTTTTTKKMDTVSSCDKIIELFNEHEKNEEKVFRL